MTVYIMDFSRIHTLSCQAVAVTTRAISAFYKLVYSFIRNEPLQTELRRGMRGWYQQADQHGAIRYVHLHLHGRLVRARE